MEDITALDLDAIKRIVQENAQMKAEAAQLLARLQKLATDVRAMQRNTVQHELVRLRNVLLDEFGESMALYIDPYIKDRIKQLGSQEEMDV